MIKGQPTAYVMPVSFIAAASDFFKRRLRADAHMHADTQMRVEMTPASRFFQEKPACAHNKESKRIAKTRFALMAFLAFSKTTLACKD